MDDFWRFWRTTGLANGIQVWLATHLPQLWDRLEKVPVARRIANKVVIDLLSRKLPSRPNPLSTMAPYTSWTSLTDRAYSGRHLPPKPELTRKAPLLDDVEALFARPADRTEPSPKSTLLFPHFAQWFTDGFLRTDPEDPRRNRSTHEIDLSQLYGQVPATTRLLRTMAGGRLKSQVIDGEEYPEFYFGPDGAVKPEFRGLEIATPELDRKSNAMPWPDHDERLGSFFALGIPRGNIHYGFAMMSTIFLREHNRLADGIALAEPTWDDERVFHTARNALIVMLLKVVIEDYINHITPFHLQLKVEQNLGSSSPWFRPNWMSIEFNMLYRWHALVPSEIRMDGRPVRMDTLLWDNRVLVERGPAALFTEASTQPAGAMGLHNTAAFLLRSERRTVEIGRACDIASFNDYRKACGYPRLKRWEDLTQDQSLRRELERVYGSIDDLEFYPGLVAEDLVPRSALPTLMGVMVAADAFTQALTNPLLAKAVFKEKTFGAFGWNEIQRTSTLQDVVGRNCSQPVTACLTREGWS